MELAALDLYAVHAEEAAQERILVGSDVIVVFLEVLHARKM